MSAKAEALGEAVTFTYDGESYTVAPSDDWDLDVLEAFEEGQVVKVTKLLLGDDYASKFRKKRRTVAELNDFWETLQEAIGAGN